MLSAYLQVQVGTKKNKTERSIYAIVLDPSNEASRYKFLILDTGKPVHSFVQEELLITDNIILAIDELIDEKLKCKKMIKDLTTEIQRYNDRYIKEMVDNNEEDEKNNKEN